LPESIPGFRLDSDRKKTRDLRLGLAALVRQGARAVLRERTKPK
jgi:hypothetical protein